MSSNGEELIDRLLQIEKEIDEQMKAGLKGAKVDLARIDKLQAELKSLRIDLAGRPDLMKKYNEREL